MAYKRAFHTDGATLHSFFYAYSAIVHNVVIVSLVCLEKHYIPLYYH